MTNRIKGNIKLGEGWSFSGERFTLEGVEWVVMYRFNDDGFLNIKVAADGIALGKANYWFSWKVDEDRPTRTRDYALMAASRPDLAEFTRKQVSTLI